MGDSSEDSQRPWAARSLCDSWKSVQGGLRGRGWGEWRGSGGHRLDQERTTSSPRKRTGGHKRQQR